VGRRRDDESRLEFVSNEISGPVYGPVIQVGGVRGDINVQPVGWPPSPNQLLPLPRLVERPDVIAALNAVRQQATDAPVTVLVTGPAGVGKSVISLAWAHLIRSEYPDAQLYADLDGHSGGAPASPAAVLGDFLHALGVPAALIPSGLSRRAALYRTLTHDRRLLVFLDDAVSAAQVRPLLPASAHGITVVTSRYRLAGLLARGARSVFVDRLDPDTSMALLADALGADRVNRDMAAAHELVDLCMRLPLALSVAAARLAARPNWQLRDMVQALADEQRRLAGLASGDVALHSALDVSVNALPPDGAWLYRLLGLVPGRTFSVDAVSALAAISGPEVYHLLDLLTDANLLTETGDGRYSFHHDLIRLHAAQLSAALDPTEERERAAARLLGWYLDTGARAERHLRPYRRGLPRDAEPPPAEPTDFADPGHAISWLRDEYDNIVAAIRYAQGHGRPTAAWQLADCTWSFYLFLARYDTRESVEKTGLAAARACGDRQAEGKMLGRLGLTLLGLGRHQEAAERLGQALDLWRELGDRGRVAGTLRRLGLVAAAAGHPNKAVTDLLAAVRSYRELGADRKAALGLVDLADVLTAEGRQRDAIVYLNQASDLLRDDPYNEARLLIAMGRAHIASGDGEAARLELVAAQAKMTELGSSAGKAEALEALGVLSERSDRLVEACHHYEAALAELGTQTTSASARLEHYLTRLSPPPGTT
jgi:tetratricopeptide (TPR) repeat protein